MKDARLLVIQHEDECPPAWFGEWFRERGVDFDVVSGHRGQPIPDGPRGYDGLVVLGGEMGANDDRDHPWLVPTKSLIATTVRAGQPFLGICLGHQLAAVALGGAVIENPNGHATGLTPVTLTSLGRADPLLGAVHDRSRAIQWNNDITSRLPVGTRVLATAPDGTVQAARFGTRAWGVQFHPEASPEIFDGWTIAKPSAATPRADGLDAFAIAREIAHARDQLRRDWAPLARRFAELVQEHRLAASTAAS